MTAGLEDFGSITRCAWCGSDPEYQRYHDLEWGFPTRTDQALFEKISLEGFQSGLSWLTILRKREAFREVFAKFDPREVGCFDRKAVTALLRDARIVRHRGKIESVVNNARRLPELQAEFGSFRAFLATFEPAPDSRPRRLTWAALRNMGMTPESTALSGELKRRGWTFVGPTTMYAFMQAAGIVNDHLHGCDIRDRVERKRSRTR
jgi:DNA-3-methyladenine glycosylase I